MNGTTISREQLEQLRNKGLRPKTQEDVMKESLQSPLEKLEEQEKSLRATAVQIQNTYSEKWYNALIQFAFKLVEKVNIDLSTVWNEEEIKEVQRVCTNAVAAAELLTEQLRRRQDDYSAYISKEAPIPETLLAGIGLIQQEIKQKLEAQQKSQSTAAGMSLEKVSDEDLNANVLPEVNVDAAIKEQTLTDDVA